MNSSLGYKDLKIPSGTGISMQKCLDLVVIIINRGFSHIQDPLKPGFHCDMNFTKNKKNTITTIF